jgi:thiol-disulfide isomerase/thioredoxin
MACLRAKPIVDGLAEEWGDKVSVHEVDYHLKGNKPLVERLSVRFTPTFVLLDKEGVEVWRQVGQIDVAAAREKVDQLSGA